jgi:hypothetical protein
MTRLITAILLLIFWPGLMLAPAQRATFFGLNVVPGSTSGGSTPTVVQTAVNTSAMNFGSGTVTLSTPATAGNVLIVEFEDMTGGAVNIVDNLSHALTEATSCSPSASPQSPAAGDPTGYYFQQFSYVVPAGGPTSLNFTFPSSYAQAVVLEVNGLASATAQSCSAPVYSYGDLNPLPSATPTAGPNLVIGVFNIIGPGTPAPGAGWTFANSVASGYDQFWVEYKVQTGTALTSAPISRLTGAPGPDATINIW